MNLREMTQAEFARWLIEQKKARLAIQAENRKEAGAPEPPKWQNWFHHVPQCPDRAPEDGRKCRLKADHPAHINNNHAGWRKVGKIKSWCVWSGGPLTANHFGVSKRWKKANRSGQLRFA